MLELCKFAVPYATAAYGEISRDIAIAAPPALCV